MRFVLLPLILLLVPVSCWAGAWVQPQNASYLKVTAIGSETDDRIDCQGSMEPAEPFGGTWSETKLFLYGEYGWTEALTAVGSFGFGEQQIVDADVPDYGTKSTGDLRLGLRWGVRRDSRAPVSIESLVSIPTYPSTDLTLPVGEREQYLPAGSGELELEVRLLAGVSFWPVPGYANLDAGYRARGGQFGDQWLLAGEVGASFDRVFTKIEIRGIWPTGDPCSTGAAGSVSIDERSLRAGPEVAVRVAGDWWLGLAWSGVLSGRNTLDNDQWLASVAWTRPGAGQ